MAQAPDGNDTLTPDDAAKILEELLDAQNHAKLLGLMLNVKPRDVEAIIDRYKDPKEQLYYIILAFLQQAELKPNWRAIVAALRSSVVGLTALANRIESNHFPNANASRRSVPDIGGIVGNEIALKSEGDIKPKSCTSQLTPATISSGKELCISPTSREIKQRIAGLKMMFSKLKKTIRDCLEKRKIVVKEVADALTSASADEDEQHKLFLENHVSILFRAADIPELFGTMNFHWNYLNPPLLDHLVQSFELEEVKGEMESYKSDLRSFIKETPLALFCHTQKKRMLRLAPEFREMVAEFDWPEDETLMLETVEQFRQEYASQYNLRDCAMMVAQIRPGSFIITLIIPKSIVKVLRRKPARAVLKKFSVTRLNIDGVCVYRLRKPLENIPVISSSTEEGVSSLTTKPKQAPTKQAKLQSEEDYLYVEQPSEDFFCPVMMGLMLQPHLTSCCGNHLSQEAAKRIQGERGVCPLCKEKHWSTMLSKHFQRQVNSLLVFCHHEERGCGWQGEMSSYQSHVNSCLFAGGPLMTELAKLPVYNEERASRIMETTISKVSTMPGTSEATIITASSKATSSQIPQLTVQCHLKGRTPVAMRRGSAISDGSLAYFASLNSNNVYQYEYKTEKWKGLPECPFTHSGLAVINGELTTVGGGGPNVTIKLQRGINRPTNKLMTLEGSQWFEKYSSMKRGRNHPTIVTTEDGTFHIAIGGIVSENYYRKNWSSSIEIFNERERKWYEAIELPTPLKYPSATISGNILYVIGHPDPYHLEESLFHFVHDGYYFQLNSESIMPSLIQIWNSLPPLPVKNSIPATIGGQLVLVGGGNIASQANSIYQLKDRRWVNIGSTNVARYYCLIVNQSPDKIMIVGGVGGERSIEECYIGAL